MKTLFTCFFLAACAQPLSAELLKPSEKDNLLKKLEAIQNSANETAGSRFKNAKSAFRSAMKSSDSAIDLYVKCVEKVNFEGRKLDSSAFRAWKKRNSNKLRNKDFGNAVRVQLSWLSLTLDAASEDADRDALAVQAKDILTSMLANAEDMAPHEEFLTQSVIESVFSKAYRLHELTVDDWEMAPANVSEAYEQIILPPLRQPNRLAALRSAWTDRMKHESLVADFWQVNRGEDKKTGERSAAYEKFLDETLPQLQWQTEVDIYKHGGEKEAAVNMLAHIEKNLNHQLAPRWAAEFINLVDPKETEEPEE